MSMALGSSSGRGKGAHLAHQLGRLQGGTYWSIRTRPDGTKQNLSLGYVTREEAQRAAERMTLEEALGRAVRIQEWHREDRDAAIRYLLGDPEVEALIAGQPDYERMSLSEYQETVYAPWREEAAPGSWRTEQQRWSQILAVLGKQALRDIDAHVVADYVDSLVMTRGARRGEPLSGNSKRLHRAAVAALLKRAYRLNTSGCCPTSRCSGSRVRRSLRGRSRIRCRFRSWWR